MSKDDMWPEQPAPSKKPESSLDDKLREILEGCDEPLTNANWALDEIKQVFADELGVDKILQDLVNLRANMQQDMIRLELTSSDPKLMSGQAYYDRFIQLWDEISDEDWDEIPHDELARTLAKKAAGLE